MVNLMITRFFDSIFLETWRLYLVTSFYSCLIGIGIYFAWLSTGLEPLRYYIWLVRLINHSNRRVIQIFTLHDNNYNEISTPRSNQNDQSERVLTQQLSNGNIRTITLNSASNLSINNINELEEESTEQTSVIIIQPPSSITRIASNQHYDESLINTVEQNGNQTLRRRFMVSESSRIHQFSLSLSSINSENNNNNNDDINSIYRFLCSNVDNEMAIAATIAMYSLRLSINGSGQLNTPVQTSNNRNLNAQTVSNTIESVSTNLNSSLNNQQILVSQVSINAEPNDFSNEQNLDVIISYDNLQNVSQSLSSTYLFDSSSSFSSEQQSTSLSDSSIITDISIEINSSSSIAERNLTNEISSFSIQTNNNNVLNQNENENNNENNTLEFSSSNNNSVNRNNLNTFENNNQNNNNNNNGDGNNYSSEIENDLSENVCSTIRLKFLDDTQRLVKTLLETTVGDFKRKHFSDLLKNGKVIRLIFQGQLLRDDSRSLASYGIYDKCAVHCHIGNRPYNQLNSSMQQQRNNNNNNNSNRQTEADSNINQENIPRTIISIGSLISSRIISIGYTWISFLLLIFWNSLIILWNWSQNIDENNSSNSWRNTIVNSIKSVVRIVLNCIFDSRTFSQHLNNDRFGDDETNYAFNVGNILGLLVTIKVLSLWFVVFYYPQFMDFKGVFLLAILTATTAFYFRARISIQNTDIQAQ